MVSTLCAYAHDLLVLPSTYLATSNEAEPYGFGFSVKVNTPGLRFDETNAMVIFDDVLVPWERVFIHRDASCATGSTTEPASCRRSCTSSRPRTWRSPSL
jgi:4-hydroxyphenylacetate 3-monooxygenase